MRKLITTTFMTLDGVMQAPGGPDEDKSNGFEHGGWSVPFWNDAIGAFMDDLMGKPFDLVLGRKTYDIFAAYWPHQGDEFGAMPLNEATKYVASRSTPNLDWDRSVLLEGNVTDSLRALKQTDGPELQVHGSGDLIQTLLGADVIDEMRLINYPVVLGAGKRLFDRGTVPTSFKVIDTSVASNGVVMSVYEPATGVAVGLFGS